MKSLAFGLILFFTLSAAAQGAGKRTIADSGIAGHVFADEVVDGQFGPGALYRLVRPANWNGRLFLYAHGAVPKSAPVALPAEADFGLLRDLHHTHKA